MAKKSRNLPSAPPTPPASFLGSYGPALLLLAAPLFEIVDALQAPFFTNRAFWTHDLTLTFLSRGSWALAALCLVVPPVRAWLARRLDGPPNPWGPFLASFGMAAWAFWIKYCQYRGFQLPGDSAHQIDVAYNTLRGNWLYDSVMGRSYISTHFAFAMPLLSPILLVWRSAVAYIFLETALLGSTLWASFLIGRRVSGSPLVGWMSLLLLSSNPFLFECISASIVDPIFLFPFLLWALYFYEARKPLAAAGWFFLTLTCSEHAPFSLMGLGLHHCLRNWRARQKKATLIGAGMFLGALTLWLLETKVKALFQGGTDRYWTYYSNLGPTQEEIFSKIFFRPWEVLWTTISPLANLRDVSKYLLGAAFLPLIAGTPTLAFLLVITPQVIAIPASLYHQFLIQYSPYALGVTVWASLHGMARLHGWLSPRQKQGWLLIFIFFFMGFGYRNATRTLLRDWLPNWFWHAPAAVRLIPKDASIWAFEYATAPLAGRTQHKMMVFWDNPKIDDEFLRELFRPDYVILPKGLLFYGKPAIIGPLLTFFAQEKYVKAFDQGEVLLLKHPLGEPGRTSPFIQMPSTHLESAKEYQQYLLQSPAK